MFLTSQCRLPPSFGLKDVSDRLRNSQEVAVMVPRRDERDADRHPVGALEPGDVDNGNMECL